MEGVTLQARAFQRFVTSGLYIMPTAPAGYLATVYLLKRGLKATKQGQKEDKTDAEKVKTGGKTTMPVLTL